MTDFDAVEFRQHHVQQNQLEIGIERALGGRESVDDDVHIVAGAAEQIHETIAQHEFVFDDENVHRAPSSVNWRGYRTSKSFVKAMIELVQGDITTLAVDGFPGEVPGVDHSSGVLYASSPLLLMNSRSASVGRR